MAPGEAVRALHQRLLTGGGRHTAAGRPAGARAGPDPDRLAQALASEWVGREAPLRRLRERAEHVATGEGGLVLVTGEAGIGKTRIVAELARRLPDFAVLYGRCDEEELYPFGPWIDMLRPHLARCRTPIWLSWSRARPSSPGCCPRSTCACPTSPASHRWASRRRGAARCSAPSWPSCAGSPRAVRAADRRRPALGRPVLAAARPPPRARAAARGGAPGRHVPRLRAAPGHPLPELLAELERGGEVPRCASTAWTSARSRS